MRAIRQRTIFEQDRAKRSIVDHKEIVAALEARDTERAERLVREHTLRLRDHVERFVISTEHVRTSTRRQGGAERRLSRQLRQKRNAAEREANVQ